MPKFLLKRWHGQHIVWIFVLLIIMSATIYMFKWWLGVTAFLVCAVLAYFTLQAETAFRKELNMYVGTITHRVKKAGNEVMSGLPIGIILYNEEKRIEWHNPFVAKMLGQDSVIGEPLYEYLPDLKNRKDKSDKVDLTIGKSIYQVSIRAEERLLYFREITEHANLARKYEDEKTAIGIVMMDNLEESTQGLDDQTRSIMLAKVTGEITEWAQKNQLYLRRTSSDRFLILMDQKALRQLEQTRFEILDDVRDLTIENKLPMTLSIGIASGAEQLMELGQMAQMGLDMSLGRGGDQVTVKVGQRLSFYGGRTNAVEKRTRVRARVISHALRDLMKDSDKVIIMGHRFPDMDCIGASIGILKAVQVIGKEGYIVLEGVNPSIHKVMETIAGDERLHRWFITPEQAMQITTQRTLAVVLDTHKASMVAEPKLLQQTHRVVVVDHHRRSEEFINDATLVYMEPYASSTCELVTELLQYINEKLTMEVLEATTLLAGIVVDTKSFSLRTGARTFEAASYLRRNGADSALIQRLLKEDLDSYIERAEVIKHTETIHEHIALAVAEPNRKYSQLMIAQVADTLLNMTNIMASFVIAERPDGLIGISARSLGQMNVQLVMERLGGGGHLTNAATQLDGTTLEGATNRLKKVLDEMQEEEGLFE
ncbi:DHH family phosphoesterase [Paenibacillus chondroitinus]|uniref:Cyclic-di-AMP phosphodiesterase n=1 Tax=Paenibacillus chondroitinus TaxID=59842 RepID=A0ABU6DIA8_9BACL|nr:MULTISPECIES: DHH family phosphoesterase [Paenibacillus]MCY9657733.1 DHH family phosphoesterase [Paenibacillus anseongense]MEB4797500.1 DHH family phosphoesterase [Paenibacillus chondroitinus]